MVSFSLRVTPTRFLFHCELLQRHKVYVQFWETCFTEDIFFSLSSSYFALFANLSLFLNLSNDKIKKLYKNYRMFQTAYKHREIDVCDVIVLAPDGSVSVKDVVLGFLVTKQIAPVEKFNVILVPHLPGNTIRLNEYQAWITNTCKYLQRITKYMQIWISTLRLGRSDKQVTFIYILPYINIYDQ